MNEETLKVLEDVARKRIGETTTSELPVKPLDLSDVVLLTMCGGDNVIITQTLIRIAITEFDLVMTESGIDLPPKAKVTVEPGSRLSVLYINPTYYEGIPDLPPYRFKRHGKVEPFDGQE